VRNEREGARERREEEPEGKSILILKDLGPNPKPDRSLLESPLGFSVSQFQTMGNGNDRTYLSRSSRELNR
jgi:hypothetical protein